MKWFSFLLQVLDGDVNMTVGTYALTLDRVKLMAFSHSYAHDEIVFAFANTKTSQLWKLMAPFQAYVWISIIIVLIISILILLSTKKLPTRNRHFIIGGRLNRTPILNMFNVLLGNPISNPIMNHIRYFGVFARTLTILWIFFCLIVRNSYQGSLYKYLQSQRIDSPYDTVDKVRASDVKINILFTSTSLLPLGYDKERITKTNFAPYTSLKMLVNSDNDEVVFTNKFIVQYFILMNEALDQIGYTHDTVVPITPAFLFPKQSIFAPMFNQKIRACEEAGLINFWIRHFKSLKKQKNGTEEHRKLEIADILALIQVCSGLYLLSSFVIVLELLSQSYKRIKKFLDFLIY